MNLLFLLVGIFVFGVIAISLCLFLVPEGGKTISDEEVANLPKNVFQSEREKREKVLSKRMEEAMEKKRKAFLQKAKKE